MALSKEAIMTGLRMPGRIKTAQSGTLKPERYTESQINRFMYSPPVELTPEHPVDTPIGRWQQVGVEAFFTPIQQARIEEITKPSLKTIWERTKTKMIEIGRLS